MCRPLPMKPLDYELRCQRDEGSWSRVTSWGSEETSENPVEDKLRCRRGKGSWSSDEQRFRRNKRSPVDHSWIRRAEILKRWGFLIESNEQRCQRNVVEHSEEETNRIIMKVTKNCSILFSPACCARCDWSIQWSINYAYISAGSHCILAPTCVCARTRADAAWICSCARTQLDRDVALIGSLASHTPLQVIASIVHRDGQLNSWINQH